MEPSYGIREKWQYNNFMFLLQGMVTEKITGKKWEENIRERIFKPLGMSNSNFSIQEMEKNADASLGYGIKKDSIIKKLDYYHIDAMGPAGSINSNVMEMSNWVSTWIKRSPLHPIPYLPLVVVPKLLPPQCLDFYNNGYCKTSGMPVF